MSIMAAGLEADEDCLAWTPREPSSAEQEHLLKVREMQTMIRQHMNGRSPSSATGNDTRDILIKNYGANWVDGLQCYQDAINSMAI